MPLALVILAAGKGTRMKSDLPKVLHGLGQSPLLHHAMASGASLDPARTIIVAGHGAEAVTISAHAFDPEATIVLQEEQNGTGHAALQARGALAGFDGDVVVLYGDTPFISAETLDRVRAARADADLVVLGFHAETPGGYGRLITDGPRLLRIVEAKDANKAERAVTLCNSGIMAAPAATLFELLDAVEPDNAQGELYLTDTVAIANDRGLRAVYVTCDEAETLGINSRAELARAEAAFQARARAAVRANGAAMQDADSVHFARDTVIGRDVVIEPFVVFGPGVTVESGASIRAFSHLEDAHVSAGAVVGPYARLRPGAEIGNDARVGNFVEVKAASIGEGAKVNHLSYIGDTAIGEAANIGAGTITCNYDGVSKHRTEIGARVFVGSNSALVAPLAIGDDAVIGSGSVITEDVPAEALAIGRVRQDTKPGRGRRLMDMLRRRKSS